jgi:hypothetical protein
LHPQQRKSTAPSSSGRRPSAVSCMWLQQFLTPPLDEVEQKSRIQFQQDHAPSLPWRRARVPQHPFLMSMDL